MTHSHALGLTSPHLTLNLNLTLSIAVNKIVASHFPSRFRRQSSATLAALVDQVAPHSSLGAQIKRQSSCVSQGEATALASQVRNTFHDISRPSVSTPCTWYFAAKFNRYTKLIYE